MPPKWAAPIPHHAPVNEPTFTDVETIGDNERLRQIEQAVNDMVHQAEEAIYENFPKDEFFYHNIEHTRMVIQNIQTVLETIKARAGDEVPDSYFAIGKLIAAYHDVIIKSSLVDNPPRRIRKSGFNPEIITASLKNPDAYSGNEEASAAALIHMIRSHPQAELFNDISNEEIFWAIGATYAPFKTKIDLPDPIRGNRSHITYPIATTVQKYAPEANILGLCLAISDLKLQYGTFEQANPDAVIHAGNAEFMEVNVGITDIVRAAVDNPDLLETIASQKDRNDEKQTIVKKAFMWKFMQEGYMLGQQFDYEHILASNPLVTKYGLHEELQQLCPDFGTNADRARAVFEEMEEKFGIVGYHDKITTIRYKINALGDRIQELSNKPGNEGIIGQLESYRDNYYLERDQLEKEYNAKIDSLNAEQLKECLEYMGYIIPDEAIK